MAPRVVPTTIKRGVYQHYKGGFYTIILVGRCSDNGPRENEYVVGYVSHTTGDVRTRFAKEFFEEVDGAPRFVFVGVTR